MKISINHKLLKISQFGTNKTFPKLNSGQRYVKMQLIIENYAGIIMPVFCPAETAP
jgi:hypothetical protein